MSDPSPCLDVLENLLEELGDDADTESKTDAIYIGLSHMFQKLKEVPEKWKKLVIKTRHLLATLIFILTTIFSVRSDTPT